MELEICPPVSCCPVFQSTWQKSFRCNSPESWRFKRLTGSYYYSCYEADSIQSISLKRLIVVAAQFPDFKVGGEIK